MRPELIEHATRLLNQAPTRCMNADRLHDLVRGDLGIELSFRRFMDAVGQRPDRFAVIACQLAVNEPRGWDGEEQAAYAHALAGTGLTSPTITLVERPIDPTVVADDTQPRDLLVDVHAALTDLLHAASDEPLLLDAAGNALAGLASVQAGLDQERRRSSTLHQSSSSSSAATTNPAADAADRMSAASAVRIPARIAQP